MGDVSRDAHLRGRALQHRARDLSVAGDVARRLADDPRARPRDSLRWCAGRSSWRRVTSSRCPATSRGATSSTRKRSTRLGCSCARRSRRGSTCGAIPGALSIDPQVTRLDDVATPSFLARRQQHLVFDATTQLRVPSAAGIAAGLAAFQNETHWYFFGTRRVGARLEVFLEKKSKASACRRLPAATLPPVDAARTQDQRRRPCVFVLVRGRAAVGGCSKEQR